jgi:hypothetical protein
LHADPLDRYYLFTQAPLPGACPLTLQVKSVDCNPVPRFWNLYYVYLTLLRNRTRSQVYSVDCNPAQSALLELKEVALRRLPNEDVWALFGEGKVSRPAPSGG